MGSDIKKIYGLVKYSKFGRIIECELTNLFPELKNFFNILKKEEINRVFSSNCFKLRKDNNLINIDNSNIKKYFRFLVTSFPSSSLKKFDKIPSVILDISNRVILISDIVWNEESRIKNLTFDLFEVILLSSNEIKKRFELEKKLLISPDYFFEKELNNGEISFSADIIQENVIKLEKFVEEGKKSILDNKFKFNPDLTVDENSILKSIFENKYLIISEISRLHNYTYERAKTIINKLHEEGYLNKIKIKNMFAYTLEKDAESLKERYENIFPLIKKSLNEFGSLKSDEILKEVRMKVPFLSRAVNINALDHLEKKGKIEAKTFNLFIYNFTFYYLKGKKNFAIKRFSEIKDKIRLEGVKKRKDNNFEKNFKDFKQELGLHDEEINHFKEKIKGIDLNYDFKGRRVRDVLLSLIFLVFNQKFDRRTFYKQYNVNRKNFFYIYGKYYKKFLFPNQFESYNKLIKEFIEKKSIPPEFEFEVKRLVEEVLSRNLHQGKQIEGVIAAVIYICSLSNGDVSFTQKQLAEYFNITEVTVRNRYKELKLKLNNFINTESYKIKDTTERPMPLNNKSIDTMILNLNVENLNNNTQENNDWLLNENYFCMLVYKGNDYVIKTNFLSFLPNLEKYYEILSDDQKKSLFISDFFKKRKQNQLIVISEEKISSFFDYLISLNPLKSPQNFSLIPYIIIDLDNREVNISNSINTERNLTLFPSDIFNFIFLSEQEIHNKFKLLTGT